MMKSTKSYHIQKTDHKTSPICCPIWCQIWQPWYALGKTSVLYYRRQCRRHWRAVSLLYDICIVVVLFCSLSRLTFVLLLWSYVDTTVASCFMFNYYYVTCVDTIVFDPGLFVSVLYKVIIDGGKHGNNTHSGWL